MMHPRDRLAVSLGHRGTANTYIERVNQARDRGQLTSALVLQLMADVASDTAAAAYREGWRDHTEAVNR